MFSRFDIVIKKKIKTNIWGIKVSVFKEKQNNTLKKSWGQ